MPSALSLIQPSLAACPPVLQPAHRSADGQCATLHNTLPSTSEHQSMHSMAFHPAAEAAPPRCALPSQRSQQYPHTEPVACTGVTVPGLPDSQHSASTAEHLGLQRLSSHSAASTSGRCHLDIPLYRGPLSRGSRLGSRQVGPLCASTAREQQPQEIGAALASGQHQHQHRQSMQSCEPAQAGMPPQAAYFQRTKELRTMGFPPWAVARAQEPCRDAADLAGRVREFRQLLPELRPPPSTHAQ